MNLVFFGSSQFAVPALKALITSGHNISCVVTQPDRHKGRGLHLEGTIIKSVAIESNLNVFQPESINAKESLTYLRQFNTDLFVVISYGQILSGNVLSIPKTFSINAHASLLPKYRGAAPINWVIINGEKSTGVTIIKLVKKMDAGPVMLQDKIKINETDTCVSLGNSLANLAAKLVIESVSLIEKNNFKLFPQNESEATLFPKLKKGDGLIDWRKKADDINALIRGLYNWPSAYTFYKNKMLKIFSASVNIHTNSKVKVMPGEILNVTKENITIATSAGELIISEVQFEGKKRMRVREFIAGHKICVGEKFDEAPGASSAGHLYP